MTATRLAGQARIAPRFAEACQRVLRRGLLAGYLQREDALPMVRR